MQVDKVSLGAKLSSEPVVASGAAPRPSSIIEILKIIIEQVLNILNYFKKTLKTFSFYSLFISFFLFFGTSGDLKAITRRSDSERLLSHGFDLSLLTSGVLEGVNATTVEALLQRMKSAGRFSQLMSTVNGSFMFIRLHFVPIGFSERSKRILSAASLRYLPIIANPCKAPAIPRSSPAPTATSNEASTL